MRVAVVTLGCKVNHFESDALVKRLRTVATVVPITEDAAVYVINTCGVTGEAAHKSRQLIYRCKRQNPDARVVVIGCYAKLEPDALRALGAEPLLVAADAEAVVSYICPDTTRSLTSTLEPIFDNGTDRDRARRYLKIQDGCDQFCSYCVIPYARGGIESRAVEAVIGAAQELEAGGAAEIVLTGIHLGKYGSEIPGHPGLADILQLVLDNTSSARLRLSSLEPTEVTDELLAIMAADPRVARHFHLPLQSGSDRTLIAMNRPYDTMTYAKVVADIHAKLPEAALTTDLIVGFPGESESDFQDSLDFCVKAGFSKVHVFVYSDRTPAKSVLLEGKVPKMIKKNRSARARKLAVELRRGYMAEQVGKISQVAVERHSGEFCLGTTGTYLPARFTAKDIAIGRLVDIVGRGVENGVLVGSLADQ